MSDVLGAVLVVGGHGGLGSAIADLLADDGWLVLRSSRTRREGPDEIVLDEAGLAALPELAAVVFAQGANVNDSADRHESGELARLLDANLTSMAEQLRVLVSSGSLRPGGRVAVVSSIWEQLSRHGKFSYTVTKAAVGGLVRAAAADLARFGILVNGVLPGVVDTAMTRSVLSDEQVARVAGTTDHGRLVRPEEVAALVAFLISDRNTAVTGQSIAIDLGYSVVRPF